MKIVFMGTPDFAVPPLKALVEAGYDVAAVVTQPDKPKGRGKSLLPTPVKEEALLHEIPVYQPQRVRNNREFLDTLREIAPDVIVVAAFGQIIPRDVLELPKYGCINIHASLLPKYRGAAPIQQAVIDGEKESGVTIMQMGEGLDTGDMLLKTEKERKSVLRFNLQAFKNNYNLVDLSKMKLTYFGIKVGSCGENHLSIDKEFDFQPAEDKTTAEEIVEGEKSADEEEKELDVYDIVLAGVVREED